MIRRVDFMYNDEYYQTNYAALGAIHAIYENKAEAEQVLQELVIEELQNNDLENYSFGYGEADEAVYEAVEAFVLEKTGEEYDKDDGIPNLEDADLFEFAKLTGIMAYQLIEVDDQQKNYVIWLPHSNEYLTHYGTGSLMFDSNRDFMQDHDENWYFFQQLPDRLSGSLADLSDSPEILKQIIAIISGIEYSEDQQVLTINSNQAGYSSLSSISALLKTPLFEIQEKNLDELANLS